MTRVALETDVRQGMCDLNQGAPSAGPLSTRRGFRRALAGTAGVVLVGVITFGLMATPTAGPQRLLTGDRQGPDQPTPQVAAAVRDRDWLSADLPPRSSGQASVPAAPLPLQLPTPRAADLQLSDLLQRLSRDPFLADFPAPDANSFGGSGPGLQFEVVYRLGSGAVVSLVQEQLAVPLPIEAVAGDGKYLYEKLPDGSELLTVTRSPPSLPGPRKAPTNRPGLGSGPTRTTTFHERPAAATAFWRRLGDGGWLNQTSTTRRNGRRLTVWAAPFSAP